MNSILTRFDAHWSDRAQRIWEKASQENISTQERRRNTCI